MKKGCIAVHLSKEPERLPVSEDVDTRGISSNIEDTNTRDQHRAARVVLRFFLCRIFSSYRAAQSMATLLTSHGASLAMCAPATCLTTRCSSKCMLVHRSVTKSQRMRLRRTGVDRGRHVPARGTAAQSSM